MKHKTMIILFLCAVFALALPLALIQSGTQTAVLAASGTLRQGDKGEKVKQLQQKLIDGKFLKGKADGVFGKKTKDAVIKFQKKNGLKADGIVGAKTAEKLGLSLGGGEGSSGDKNKGDSDLLARVVYGESRGEPYKGKVAVAAVVLNRVDDPNFPNSMSGVVYQPGAFSIVADGQINMSPDSEAIRAARDALNGVDPTSGCIYYYNPKKTTNKWILGRPIYLTIGEHVFCK